MSVAELQKIIRRLSVEDRRSLAVVAARMVRSRKPASRRTASAKTMLSVLGCARKMQPGKDSRQILTEMRGYERGEL